MKVQTDILKWALAIIDKVPATPGNRASQLVRLKKAKGSLLLSVDGVAHGRATIEAEGDDAFSFTLDRHVLSAFSSCGGRHVDANLNNSGLLIKSGSHKMQAHAIEEEIGEVQLPPQSSLKRMAVSNEFAEGVLCASNYASTSDSSPHLECVHIKKGHGVLATDGIVACSAKGVNVAKSFSLPLLIAAGLKGADALLIGADGASASYSNSENTALLYQPFVRAAQAYPTQALINLLAKTQTAKPILAFEAGQLNSGFAKMKQFVQEKMDTFSVTCQAPAGKGYVQLVAQLTQGPITIKVATAIPNTKDVESLWRMTRLTSWLDYVGSKAVVTFALVDKVNTFVALNKRSVLVQTELIA